MEVFSLYELNGKVRRAVEDQLNEEYWVRAEMSSVNINAAGHCYIELVQKNEKNNSLLAKARATVWANRLPIIKGYFEQETGQAFVAGISVQLLVTVQFHELYGMSLLVQDIDPTYTLGDMARRRREILRQLEEEGTLTMNKELPMPLLPQRVAVISSETAAGYGDFCNQLHNNTYGLVFYTRLFPAVMQGDKVEESIIAALDAIASSEGCWDVVVIIRGGGATSDLAGFDTYALASNCAQFPLPIITGIGHERDDTVVDAVAHTRVKTPTAAASFLIDAAMTTAMCLDEYIAAISSGIREKITREQQRLQYLSQRIPSAYALSRAREEHLLERLRQRMSTGAGAFLSEQRHKVALVEKVLAGAAPENILRRGYSITLLNGKVLRDASEIREDDILCTRLASGSVRSKVIPKTDKED
ncbi:MAG: exodeoxyribonuclease VII large subunit [Bacteroidaceae bacterium]|nr:exodeoxyribonuclease VII large subunit [Bacteroidaceae bacterium]